MSKRDNRLILNDMLESIEKIERYTTGMSWNEFMQNQMVIDAVVRNLEIIGEASRFIPSNLRDLHTEIDWARVIGFRNIVIHEYFDVDLEIVWTIATQRLSELKVVLQQMLDETNRPD